MIVETAGRVLIGSIVVSSAICVAIPVSCISVTGRPKAWFPNIGRKHPCHAIDVPNWGELLGVVVLLCNRVVNFDLRADFQRAQDLVAAGHDFLTIRQSLRDLNVCRTLDPSLYRLEIDLLRGLLDHEHTLN